MKAALIQALLVGFGGFAGALLRMGLGGLVQRRVAAGGFPYGTLTVNLVGCLAIGAFVGVAETRASIPRELRLFVLVGLLGGFTTFSTFGNEAFAMLRQSEYARACGYVGAHVLIGIACVWLGFVLTAK